jgi:hypothetical protein
MFVAHKGQEFLEMFDLHDIKDDAMIGVVWGKFSFKMTKMIAEKMKAPSLREWVLPSFTTTTKVDEAVAAILIMATLRKYFIYGCKVACSLPSVTLLGQSSNWEKLVS